MPKVRKKSTVKSKASEKRKTYRPKKVPKGRGKKKAICGHVKKDGERCERTPGWGTDHPGVGYCKHHDNDPKRKSAAVVLGEALPNGPLMGTPVNMTPDEGIMRVIAVTAGEAAWCDAMIRELSSPYEPRPGYQKQTSRKTSSSKGMEKGFDTDVEGEEETVTESERGRELNLWIRERQKVMDRLARYCKMAADMGVAQRQIALMETQAQLLVKTMEAIFVELALDAGKRARAVEILHRELLTLEQPATIEQ